MKKIAFFSKNLDFGGIEKVLIDYANYLSSDNEVYFILGTRRGGLLSYLSPGVGIIELHAEALKQSLFRLVGVLRKNRFDVVISGSESCNILLAIANCLIPKRSKIITSQHSFLNSDTSRFRHEVLLPWALKRSSLTLCVSEGIRDMLVGQKIRPSKLRVLYNPVDRAKILENSKKEIKDYGDFLVFVGRIYEVKNIPFLLKSFKIFLESNPGFKLVLIGDGPERDRSRQFGEELGIGDRLVWVGATSNPYPYVRQARALVLSSLSESFSTVIVEAMCLGKTVVSTPCAGPMEILHAPEYGYVSKSFDDCVEFAGLMDYAIKHEIPSDKLEEYSKGFDSPVSAIKLGSIIDEVTGRH